MWNLYIVNCRDNTFYTGITNNLKLRIKNHNCGKGCRYTRSRYPVKLVYSQKFPTKSKALKREIQIKKLIRLQKIKLIESNS
ncbi:MAG: GIY-YIG nuclease family protein [Candidatus Omnitrophica bacterium]|nr:GIY-YIG nuclease family protein [Candidatus Omnitrophota bacterium]